MKKICFVIPTMGFGGMQRVIANFCNYYADNNYKVILYVLYGEEVFFSLNKNVQVEFYTSTNTKSFFNLNKLNLLFNFRKKIKEIKPDYLVLFGSYQSILLAISLIGLKVNTFISERQNPHISRGIITDFLKFFVYPNITGIFAQTNYVKNFIDKKYNTRNVFVVNNPLNINVELLKPNERKNIIIRAGRLEPEKRFDELIDIFSKVENDDWELHIIGDGSCRKELEKQVTNLKLNHKVKFLGVQEDIFNLINKAKIFAFTSAYEGFPNALCEGMFLGLSCISYDIIAGPSDIIDDGKNGFLIPNNEKDMFINKLNLLMKDEDLQNKFFIESLSIRKKLSINTISDNLIIEMNKCIGKQSSK